MGWAPYVITATSGGLTTATNAYVTGNQLGTEITLTAAAAGNNGHGAIVGVELIDYANIVGAIDVLLFSDTTTPAADRAAAAWSDADSNKSIAGTPITLPGPTSLTNNRISGVGNIWIPYQSGSSHANLYCDLITRSGHTFFGAVTDLHLTINVMRFS
jgi:hypothetical protein